MTRLTTAQRRIERAQKTIAKSEAVLRAEPVAVSPFIAGGSNYSPTMSKRLDQQMERTIDAAVALQQAQRDLTSAQALQAGIAAGELNANGQRRKDAPSKLRRKEIEAEIAAVIRSLLKVGDTVTLVDNHHSTLIVKRLNAKTLTDEHGEKWQYHDVLPMRDGKPMTGEMLVAARRVALEAKS